MLLLWPSAFFPLQAELVVLVSAFEMVSTDWSVSCLQFFYSRSPVPSHLQKWGGGTCPRALWSRGHLNAADCNDVYIAHDLALMAPQFTISLTSALEFTYSDGSRRRRSVHGVRLGFVVVLIGRHRRIC